ncbi:SOS response-associated peptidase family protein [Pseudomonas sp. SWRI92]|uniref:SOS response-associated peptidase family protein n=1 Tax=Pseudomonas marvdashtae TaxID=2745500 RepID=A0A923JNI0_9PSED|nr:MULTISPECIES: SOS response-associated peptidase family protein [Pseudomonas]MBC3374924.1 SOS response-associated peptidase family protein [Pseudomonas sp. SWRI92]MBV4551355.1 SOS response-associated peptidase family protein [Pseudomonas marvdashtae]
MCECFVQPVSSKDSLAFFAQRDTFGASHPPSLSADCLHAAAEPTLHDRQTVIKPNMQVSAIRNRGGRLECIKVRWGWSPVWSMGTMPPLTHLPLHLVMRSKVFDRIKRDGRVLVAVDGWYEASDTAAQHQAKRLSYTTSRQSSPIFLAALAQASERPNGCDGLALVTYGDVANQQQRLLAFTGENALEWLRPDLDWEQARHMAAHVAVTEPQLEHVLTAKRMVQGRR